MSNKYIESLISDLNKEGVYTVEQSNGTIKNNSYLELSNKIIDDLEKKSHVKLSSEQKDILTHNGSMVIIACAGSGKTMTSTFLIAKRILSGEIKDTTKLIYTTYSKSGATEMKQRLDDLFDRVGMSQYKKNVQVRTLHSFFYEIIRNFGIKGTLISNGQRASIIKRGCIEAGVKLNDDELQIIDNLISYQVNNTLHDEEVLMSPPNTIDRSNLTVAKYKKIRIHYIKEKREKNLIDFDDMQQYMYQYVVKYKDSEDPKEREIYQSALNYCKAYYTDFYIDEAQDVSKIQYKIIKAIVEDPNKPGKLDRNLVFIGDDDQCMYSWRGSNPEIIIDIGPEFGIPVYMLGTNYRCKNDIVNYAANSIKYNKYRFGNKSMQAYNDGGDVKFLVSHKVDLCNLSLLAFKQIKKWKEDGCSYDDMAVLARNNFHLAILGNLLANYGIYCKMTEDMKMTKSALYKDLKGIIELTGNTRNEDLTAKLLWKLCSRMSTSTAKIISNYQGGIGMSFRECIEYVEKRYLHYDSTYNPGFSVISGNAESNFRHVIVNLSDATKDSLDSIYAYLLKEDRVTQIQGLMSEYLKVTESYLYRSEDKRRSAEGMVLYFNYILKTMGVDSALVFFRNTEQLEDTDISFPGETVTLSTIHSAKGREWKNVILFAIDNVSIPSFDGICKMISDGVNFDAIMSSIDEERRIFYVGNTRAKDHLVTITTEEPSVFILESLGAYSEDSHSTDEQVMKDAQFRDDFDNRFEPFIKENLINKNGKYHYEV